MMKRFFAAGIASAAFFSTAAGVASAGQKQPASGLPGVDEKAGDKVVVVAPAAEPAEDPSSRDEAGFVRLGDWDVKISGSVQVDITAGKPRPFRDSGGR